MSVVSVASSPVVASFETEMCSEEVGLSEIEQESEFAGQHGVCLSLSTVIAPSRVFTLS